MQATCEKCGKTITQKDFSAGRYYLFWITPTIPSESLYLCSDTFSFSPHLSKETRRCRSSHSPIKKVA